MQYNELDHNDDLYEISQTQIYDFKTNLDQVSIGQLIIRLFDTIHELKMTSTDNPQRASEILLQISLISGYISHKLKGK